MGDAAVNYDGYFRYKDYRRWPDDERWELVDGQAMAMGAPSATHQRMLAWLYRRFYDYFEAMPCEVFFAPFDVLLPDGDEDDDEVSTVVQPDLMVFCEPGTVGDKYARGAPSLVIEIISPSSSKWDQNEKFRRYERAGVREYWIVDPLAKWLCVYTLGDNGAYGKGRLYEKGDKDALARSALYPGLELNAAELLGWDAPA